MAVFIPTGNFNPSSLSADDLYIVIQNPPGYVSGIPTDVIGVVGTASWGPTNSACAIGSATQAQATFGSISAASLTDPYDLATDLALAFGQASSAATLEGWAVRVSDGTDVAASAAIPGVASAASLTATVAGTITAADQLTLHFTSSALYGSPVLVAYTVQSSDTLASIAANLAKAVNATPVLANAGIFALVNPSDAEEVLIYQPAALSPQVTLTASVSSGATETLTAGTSGPTSTAGLTLSGIYTGVLGNQIQAVLQAGAQTNTFTALLALPALGMQESFPNIPAANFWKALQTAINLGLSGVRGPSQICRASNANPAVGNPTLQTTTLSGGTDGRSGVTTSILLGSSSALPPTGLYALAQQIPNVSIVWLVGCVDPNSVSPLVSFGQSNGCSVLVPFAGGTTTAAAISAVQTNGVHDPSLMYVKDWIYWFDPINNQVRYSPPTAVIGGLAATLPPWENPGNTPTNMVIATDRINPPNGYSYPYQDSEIGMLANAGICFIANPIPAGSEFGIRTAQTTSLNPTTAGFEWWRMSCYLAKSFMSFMGSYVDANQSQQPVDPTRSAIKNQLNAFLASLGTQIDGYSVICTFSSTGSPGNGVNTPTSIQQGFLYCLVKVTYLATVRFFILTLQGGTTVVTVGSTPGQQLAA